MACNILLLSVSDAGVDKSFEIMCEQWFSPCIRNEKQNDEKLQIPCNETNALTSPSGLRASIFSTLFEQAHHSLDQLRPHNLPFTLPLTPLSSSPSPSPSSQTTFFCNHSSHCSPLNPLEIPFSTTPSNTTVGVTCTPCIRFILTNTFNSFVTPLPVFSDPSSAGLSEICSNLYISLSLMPTEAPILDRRA